MNVSLESRHGIQWATVTGHVSLEHALQTFRAACDRAVEAGLQLVIVDFRNAQGELTELERYELGASMAKYCLEKPLHLKVATVGGPPLISGFAALVASNRGVSAETFPEISSAIHWLTRFRSGRFPA